MASERLEERSLLTVSATFIAGELEINLEIGDDVTVRENPVSLGNVQILANGLPLGSLGNVPAASVSTLLINGGDEANVIDLTGMQAAVFSNPALVINVRAGNGEDTLLGSPNLSSSLDGGHGDDTIIGGAAADTLLGDDGDDAITAAGGDDSVNAGDGQDTVDGGGGNDTILGGDGEDSIGGAGGNDSITSDDGADTVNGGDGNDTLNGMAGADVLNGNNGDDSMLGGAGDDTISGNDGNDFADGQAGFDSLFGGDGNDFLSGGADNDSVAGEAGDDTVNGAAGNDTVDGADGNDSMLGGNGNDSMLGGFGDDTGRGQGGNDTLIGSDGTDLLDGGIGNDLIVSGGSAVPILVSVSNVTLVEGTGTSTTALFTVTLSSASLGSVTVDFATTDGTGVAPADYTSTAGTLNFVPGTTTLTVSVPIVSDSDDEFNETFTLDLSNSVNATISDGTGLATIIDDDGPSTIVSTASATASALEYLGVHRSEFGLTYSDLQNSSVIRQYTDQHNGVTHVYLQQTHQGLPIVDTSINVNVDARGKVINAYSSFVPNVASFNTSTVPGLTATQAFAGLGLELAEYLQTSPHGHGSFVSESGSNQQSPNQRDQSGEVTATPVTPLNLIRTSTPDRLQWVMSDDGELELAWTINVKTTEEIGWYDASVNAITGEVIHNVSYVHAATYNGIPYTEQNPTDGGRVLNVNPENSAASPFGWHDTNGVAGAEFTDTRGNNIFAQPARDDNPIILFLTGQPGTGPRPNGGSGLTFDFPFDDTQNPSTYVDAATTNLFYVTNVLHDLHYQYGFDEVSGNFQVNNYGNGGLGNDPVLANAQAGANLGFRNNAFMATPPDGQSPTIAMFTWSITNPERDGDFDNGIIVHEYGHGVSNRLTGNGNGLNALQSGGMGEGWSDWWSIMFTQETSDTATTPRAVGTYVFGQPLNGGGIRRFPYSFDMSVNPLTLANYNGDTFPQQNNTEVHNSGEIWTTVLWDMNWLLINGISTPDCEGNTTPGLGFDSDLYNGTGGNNVALQLVMDGLKLQPLNPTFIQARDAILQADTINNGGANHRAIWTAFARRGFGFSASAGPNADSLVVTPAFDLPPELGAIRFDQSVYTDGDLVGITVCDTDRASGAATLTVTVTTTGGDSEQVLLTRQPDQTFFGTIPIQRATPVINNSFIDVPNEADLMTASYVDANTGTAVNVTVTALAAINAGQGDTLIGGDGDDSLVGGSGNDSIEGNGGNDTVQAGDGNDSVLGGSGRDLIDGQTGNDTLRGQGGADTLIGGEGDDVFEWDATADGVDEVSSISGSDEMRVFTGIAADTVTISKSVTKLQVTSGGNVLTINPTIRIVNIDTGEGADTITVGDLSGVVPTVLTINGGLGNDIINAGAAVLGFVRMQLNGNDGNDSITGSKSDDTIEGGAGLDTLNGGLGNDTIRGGADIDNINGGAGDDSIEGNDGNDSLVGGAGNDVMQGGLGNDLVSGNAGHDTLEGNDGRDSLHGGIDNDSLDGGLGKDTLNGAAGNDTIDGGRNDDLIAGDVGDDSIRGDHGNDIIDSGPGADIVNGGDGNDSLSGGDGNDLIAGGNGNDTINAGEGDDLVTGGDGRDNILGGGGNDGLLGNDGDDTINGQSGANTLAGGQGVDSLIGAASEIDERFTLDDDLLVLLGLL